MFKGAAGRVVGVLVSVSESVSVSVVKKCAFTDDGSQLSALASYGREESAGVQHSSLVSVVNKTCGGWAATIHTHIQCITQINYRTYSRMQCINFPTDHIYIYIYIYALT